MKDTGIKLAKRYARAFFELFDHSQLEWVRDSLQAFTSVWNSHLDLRDAISNPSYPVSQRMEVLREICSYAGQADERFINLLQILLGNSRMDILPELTAYFAKMVDELKAILSLKITSAFPLSDHEKGEIVSRVQNEFGKLASVQWDVDPGLIGGLVVKSGDLILDNSLRGALSKIKSSLEM